MEGYCWECSSTTPFPAHTPFPLRPLNKETKRAGNEPWAWPHWKYTLKAQLLFWTEASPNTHTLCMLLALYQSLSAGSQFLQLITEPQRGKLHDINSATALFLQPHVSEGQDDCLSKIKVLRYMVWLYVELLLYEPLLQYCSLLSLQLSPSSV